MVDLIEYPANKVAPDALPGAGDRYEAFGLAHKFAPPMLAFVFPDRSMTALRYDHLDLMHFQPLDGDACHGEGVITLSFGKKMGLGVIVVVTGRNLDDCFAHLAHHRVHWMWELPEGRAAAGDGAPVIHAIELKDATPENLAALLP